MSISTPAPASGEPAGGPRIATYREAFADGLRAATRSVFLVVLIGSYVSIGALAHDLGFPLGWTVLSTLLVWAAPAQVILITALGAGATPAEAAVAVGLSGIRLLPMVIALLPVLRAAKTKAVELIPPAHFTAVSVWIETLRLAPKRPRGNRIAFANGLAIGLMGAAVVATVIGFELAGTLPQPVVAALLFLTPISFFTSAIRAARLLSDRLAFVIGIVMAPALVAAGIDLDLLWTGLVGGSAAYGLHRWREARR
jgi:predicted branched-subunit amino acid permease